MAKTNTVMVVILIALGLWAFSKWGQGITPAPISPMPMPTPTPTPIPVTPIQPDSAGSDWILVRAYKGSQMGMTAWIPPSALAAYLAGDWVPA